MSCFNPFDQMTFTNDRCFLCGELLTDENRTKEHVYPKWLQNKFNLWNDSLILLNRTPIKYKDLTIPCCKRCNGIMSEKLEKPIQRFVGGGYDAFVECDKNIVFQWLTKISYAEAVITHKFEGDQVFVINGDATFIINGVPQKEQGNMQQDKQQFGGMILDSLPEDSSVVP